MLFTKSLRLSIRRAWGARVLAAKLSVWPTVRVVEMNVVFRAVQDVTPKMLRDNFRQKRVVMDCAVNCIEFSMLVGQRLQECGATRARSPQYRWK